MNRAFTTREKVLLVILAVLIIGIGYFKLLLEPINTSIENYQNMTASEQDEILVNTALLQKKKQMETELEELFANGDPTPIPVYDNSGNLLVELHRILDKSLDYSLNFSGTSPMDVEYLVRRPVSLTFQAPTYAQARAIIDELHDSDNVNCISDLSIQINNGNLDYTNEIIRWDLDDDSDYYVTVSLVITYYERVVQ